MTKTVYRPDSHHFFPSVGSCLLAAGATLLIAQPCSTGSPRFVAAGNLNTPRTSQQTTILADGRVLVVGGRDKRLKTLASAEVYDPTTKTWSLTGSMSSPRRSHTVTLLSNGMVLGAGGGTYRPFAVTAELYDPATGIWTLTGSPIATARIDATATLLANGKVLVAAGNDGKKNLRSAELYDPATGTWSATGDLNTARNNHTATLLANGDVLVTGGFTSDIAVTGTAEIYHTATGHWTSTGNLIEGRHSHTATLLPDDTVMVAGGAKFTTGFITVALATAEIFHPDTDTWSATSSLAEARTLHTATLLASGQALAVGGFGSGGLSLGSAELYDSATGNWIQSTAALKTPRHGHSAAPLLDGSVLIAAGIDQTGTNTFVLPQGAEDYVNRVP